MQLRVDSTGGLVPIKATNIDWEDLNGIVHDLTHDQNPKIFIQPTATATEQVIRKTKRSFIFMTALILQFINRLVARDCCRGSS